ncbi:MAG: hypothetical protein AseanaTS_18920 [Candidatus Pelagadaptatus aseana]|uniref:sensor domain-containing diguanylate cyclase n=1 Tax=Candidatus Pelagadaptatus aseana TaxID=3120508 RepID=UPI0039B3074C
MLNRKPSFYLILMSAMTLVIGVFAVFLIHKAEGYLQDDARIINQAGLIRGGIQRITKIIMINPDLVSQSEMDNIDDRLNYFLDVEDQYVYRKEGALDYRGVGELKLKWRLLKESLEDYKQAPTMDKQQLILQQSEVCWSTAVELVHLVQKHSEHKVRSIRLTLYLMFFAVATIVVLVIVILIFYVTRKLEQETIRDHLTGAYNRRMYDTVMEEELVRCNRYNASLSLILIDLDHFKQINDQYGHKAGDQVLIDFTKLMQSSRRKTDHFYRLGGEEFAIICSGADLIAAIGLAEKMCGQVANNKFSIDGQVTASFGVAQYVNGDSDDALYHQADLALYQAKRSGRNRVEVYDPKLDAEKL